MIRAPNRNILITALPADQPSSIDGNHGHCEYPASQGLARIVLDTIRTVGRLLHLIPVLQRHQWGNEMGIGLTGR